MCKCPVCKEEVPPVENADWVIQGVVYCNRECYDETIAEMMKQIDFPSSDAGKFHLRGDK